MSRDFESGQPSIEMLSCGGAFVTGAQEYVIKLLKNAVRLKELRDRVWNSKVGQKLKVKFAETTGRTSGNHELGGFVKAGSPILKGLGGQDVAVGSLRILVAAGFARVLCGWNCWDFWKISVRFRMIAAIGVFDRMRFLGKPILELQEFKGHEGHPYIIPKARRSKSKPLIRAQDFRKDYGHVTKASQVKKSRSLITTLTVPKQGRIKHIKIFQSASERNKF
ncbi:Hypothetical predicted protein [Prunus dulcis]|uniref:Uncharacterized protein n=1 Tax=Prunus dulcis TaxID=3755 RepID=A0A5E4F4D8_PRUDU|nr:Hypothetical predicted protein [Prunus dulcis]